jgi:hypothetical protein
LSLVGYTLTTYALYLATQRVLHKGSSQSKSDLPCSGITPVRLCHTPIYSRSSYAGGTSEPQNLQRRASKGISLRHSGHFRVVGSAGGSFRDRAMRALTGFTTKKNKTAAMRIKAMTTLIKSPYLKTLLFTVNVRAEKSGLPKMAAIRGVMRSAMNAETTAKKAKAMINATARSTTFPRSKNCLNSLASFT